MSTVTVNAQYRHMKNVLRQLEELHEVFSEALSTYTECVGPLPQDWTAEAYLHLNSMGTDLDQHHPNLPDLFLVDEAAFVRILDEEKRRIRDWFTDHIGYAAAHIAEGNY